MTRLGKTQFLVALAFVIFVAIWWESLENMYRVWGTIVAGVIWTLKDYFYMGVPYEPEPPIDVDAYMNRTPRRD